MTNEARVRFLLIIGFVGLSWPSCKTPTSTDNHDPVWIAVVANISGYEQIVLVDFHDPRNYRQITDNNHVNSYARFSPNREKLVFLDRLVGYDHNPQIVLYFLKQETIDFLRDSTWPGSVVGGNIPIVWSSDQSDIYFRFRPDPFSDDLYSFNFTTRKINPLIQTPLTASEYAVGMLNADSMVIFSNDTATTNGPIGFYYWSQTAGYGQFLSNPNLQYINVGGIAKKAARNLDWSDKRQLFVLAQSDSTMTGYRIAITNLTGSVFQAYTNGDFLDDHPVWGPDENTVLFDRVAPSGGVVTVMVLNLTTGGIHELVSVSSINGATELRMPDY